MEQTPIIERRLLSVKQHEIWQGNNRIYCKGRLITGPDRAVFWLTVLLIVVPFSLFFYSVCYPLWETKSPVFMFLGILFSVFILLALCCCALSDPGIIPRVLNPVDPPSSKPREVIIKGQTIELTYCMTCHIWRPLRTHHCSICNNCVSGFDHHCPWVGNCIGARNYRMFIAFLWITLAGSIYVALTSLVRLGLFESISDFPNQFSEFPIAGGLLVYAVIIIVSVGGMTLYHCYLIGAGKTTYEAVKVLETDHWDQGCLSNFKDTLCGPMEPSKINLRGPVSIDTIKMPTSTKLGIV